MNKRLGKEVRKLVEHLYDDMLFAKTLLPFGLQTQFQGGMKSGWSCTAPDNSIIHSLLIETFKALYSLEFRYVVYGDDLFIVHELYSQLIYILSLWHRLVSPLVIYIKVRYKKLISYRSTYVPAMN